MQNLKHEPFWRRLEKISYLLRMFSTLFQIFVKLSHTDDS